MILKSQKKKKKIVFKKGRKGKAWEEEREGMCMELERQ